METHRNTIVKGYQKTAIGAAWKQQGLRVPFAIKNHALRAVFADSIKHGKGIGIPRASIVNKTKMSTQAKRKVFANLLFAIAVDQGREGEQYHPQSQNCQNEIDQKGIIHNFQHPYFCLLRSMMVGRVINTIVSPTMANIK